MMSISPIYIILNNFYCILRVVVNINIEHQNGIQYRKMVKTLMKLKLDMLLIFKDATNKMIHNMNGSNNHLLILKILHLKNLKMYPCS